MGFLVRFLVCGEEIVVELFGVRFEVGVFARLDLVLVGLLRVEILRRVVRVVGHHVVVIVISGHRGAGA